MKDLAINCKDTQIAKKLGWSESYITYVLIVTTCQLDVNTDVTELILVQYTKVKSLWLTSLFHIVIACGKNENL